MRGRREREAGSSIGVLWVGGERGTVCCVTWRVWEGRGG